MSILIIRDNNQAIVDVWEIDERQDSIYDELSGKNYEVTPDEHGETQTFEDDEGQKWSSGSTQHQILDDIFNRRLPHHRLQFPLNIPRNITIDYVSFTY